MASLLIRAVSLALTFCLASPAFAKDFTTYSNTNQLIWDKKFKPALVSFLGSRKASYFWKNDLVWKQVLEGLGGPPEKIIKIQPGLYLASACRAHSCDEKSAVVIENPYRIVAVGLIEYGCFHSDLQCSTPTLQVFVKQRNEQAEQALFMWAKSVVERPDIKLTVLK